MDGHAGWLTGGVTGAGAARDGHVQPRPWKRSLCTRAAWAPSVAVLLAGLLGLSSCGGGAALGDSQGFVAAESHTLEVGASAGQEVKDAVSGYTFRFPSGGSGQLGLTRLSGTPAAPPSPGQAWRVTFSGSQPVELVLGGAYDGSAAWPVVYVYDQLATASIDDAKGRGPRWVTVPSRTLSTGRQVFELSARSIIDPAATTTTATTDAGRERAQATTAPPARDYWISTLTPGSSEVDRRMVRSLQALTYTDQVKAVLSPALAKTFESNRARRPLSWGDDGNYYTGFFTFTDAIWHFSPRLTVTLDLGGLPHELSHYHTHLLVGDETYRTLESRGYWNYPTNHVINTLVNRQTINEDYAFVLQQFLMGSVGSFNLFEPGVYLIDRPAGGDVPSLEGFTAAMLASLVRPTTAMLGIDNRGKTVTVPVIGKTWSQVMDIVAAGKTDVDSLRRHIDGTLDTDGRSRFLVALQRLGWRYAATLRAVDQNGQAVADADARLLVRNSAGEFVSDVGRTDAEGRLNLWFAFPGAAVLELKRAGETLEGVVTLNPDRPTPERIALGDVPVLAVERFAAVEEVCASFSYTTITALSRIEAGPYSRVECVKPSTGKPLFWSGSLFYVQDGTTYLEGVYLQAYAQLQNVKARRPLSGRYATPPPLFEILSTDMPRDLSSSLVRFKLQGTAANGRYTILYQPEDDCSGGFCERNLVQAVVPGSVSVWVTFRAN